MELEEMATEEMPKIATERIDGDPLTGSFQIRYLLLDADFFYQIFL
jgi:hypothetical protein